MPHRKARDRRPVVRVRVIVVYLGRIRLISARTTLIVLICLVGIWFVLAAVALAGLQWRLTVVASLAVAAAAGAAIIATVTSVDWAARFVNRLVGLEHERNDLRRRLRATDDADDAAADAERQMLEEKVQYQAADLEEANNAWTYWQTQARRYEAELKALHAQYDSDSDARGQGLVEYVLILAFIVVLVMVLLSPIGTFCLSSISGIASGLQ